MHKKIFLFLIAIWTITAQPARCQQPWYQQILSSSDKYHSDYVLKANESRIITFDTDKKLLVGFWTNTAKITGDQVKKYMGNFPIVIEHKQEKRMIRSLFGSSALFRPIEGKIVLELRNESPDDFQLVVYTHPLNFSD